MNERMDGWMDGLFTEFEIKTVKEGNLFKNNEIIHLERTKRM